MLIYTYESRQQPNHMPTLFWYMLLSVLLSGQVCNVLTDDQDQHCCSSGQQHHDACKQHDHLLIHSQLLSTGLAVLIARHKAGMQGHEGTCFPRLAQLLPEEDQVEERRHEQGAADASKAAH